MDRPSFPSCVPAAFVLALMLFGTPVHAEEKGGVVGDCLKYLPEIGRSVRIPCADEAPEPEPAKPKVETPPPAATPKQTAYAPLTLEQERALKPGMTFKECNECPELVVVPAGSVRLGSPGQRIVAL